MATLKKSNTDQLEELITCALCLDALKDPRILPCSHTFCCQCIRQLVNDGKVNCPFQDNQTIDQSDIDKLPINRMAKDMVDLVASITSSTDLNTHHPCENCTDAQAVNWCEKCGFHYCQSCTTSAHSIKALQSHTIVPSSEKTNSFCSEHPDEKFKFWCTQCDALVCRDCLLFKHKDHQYLSTKDAAGEATAKFQSAMQQINEVKQNLTAAANRTKEMMEQQAVIVQRDRQTIEQTFVGLQRMSEERKCKLIEDLEGGLAETMEILTQRQISLDEHLRLATAQELCIRKMLISTDPVQKLTFKSTFSQNNEQFFKQYQTIGEGCMIKKPVFKNDERALTHLSDMISGLGNIQSATFGIREDWAPAELKTFDISIPGAELLLTPKIPNWARGYTFTLKQPLRLHGIRIQSDYNGQHVGFVVTEAGVVVHTATVSSHDSTLKWLTVPLKCDIEHNNSVFVWAESHNGSYTYKSETSRIRVINSDCSVTSKAVQSVIQIRKGSTLTITHNIYSIDMILDIEP